ncbi:MAG: hypothetical protein JSV14_12255 [Deltaproteobacteria bacterium]|nr:MAG: hypothetical protein JSV14_12255 [Deltaproteobacteria bacterium]
MDSEDARVLLQSTQRVRTLWAGVISRDFVYAVGLNAAIWTYFLQAYVESLASKPSLGFSYLAVAAGLSSLILGLWRVFTSHTYGRIAGLYPDLLLCEQSLGVETNQGTAGYLSRTIPRLSRILSGEELNPNQKSEAVSFLARKKSMGRLSHVVIDITVLAVIVGMFVLCISMYSKIQFSLAIGSIIATLLGFLLLLFSMLSFQRYPSQAVISEAITKYEEE